MRNNVKIIMLLNYVKGLMKKYFSNYEVHASCRHEERLYWLFWVYTLNAKSERNHAKIQLPMQAPQSLILSFQFCCQATVVWRLVGCCPCCNEWEEADSGMVETFTSSSPVEKSVMVQLRVTRFVNSPFKNDFNIWNIDTYIKYMLIGWNLGVKQDMNF